MSIPPSSSFALIFDTITVILTIITTAYYWLVIPRPISGARDTAATFQNDVGVHFPGVWWIRSFTLLGSCSSVALLVTGALGRDGVAVRLGYCVAVFQLLTEFEFIPSLSGMLNAKIKRALKLVVWAERLVSLVELSAIMLVWSLRPEGREYIPIVLLAGSAFKYAILVCTHAVIDVLQKSNRVVHSKKDWRSGIALYLYYLTSTVGLLVIGLCIDRFDLSTCVFLLLASSHLSFSCLIEILLGIITGKILKQWNPDLEMKTNLSQRKGDDLQSAFDWD